MGPFPVVPWDSLLIPQLLLCVAPAPSETGVCHTSAPSEAGAGTVVFGALVTGAAAGGNDERQEEAPAGSTGPAVSAAPPRPPPSSPSSQVGPPFQAKGVDVAAVSAGNIPSSPGGPAVTGSRDATGGTPAVESGGRLKKESERSSLFKPKSDPRPSEKVEWPSWPSCWS